MERRIKTHIFGPVLSRRLGRSLGVDVTPFKTCSFDCVYCQLGRTEEPTIARRPFVQISNVLEQLTEKLKNETAPDFITFSGSGEPTLYSNLGELIAAIKELTNIPVAVITNSSLLWNKEVREELLGANLIIPSIDAGDSMTFQRINRPYSDLVFHQIVEGLIELRKAYKGQIWLEVFLLDGINTAPSQIAEIKKHVEAVQPDRIQLNTIDRPPAEDSVQKVPHDKIISVRDIFGERAEVIAPYEEFDDDRNGQPTAEDILAMIRRRPCTLKDIADGLRIHKNEALKHLVRINERQALQKIRKDGSLYYQAAEDTLKDAKVSMEDKL